MIPEFLPSAPDIDRAVLASVLFDPELVAEALDAGVEVFYNSSYRVMAQGMADLNEQMTPVDQLTLTDWLRRNELLDAVGGETAVAGLAGDVVAGANMRRHMDILRENAARRRLAIMGSELARKACDLGNELASSVANHESALAELHGRLGKRKWSLTEQIREWVLTTEGNFSTTDVHKELDLTTRDHKKFCTTILGRLVQEGLIERWGDRRGTYRRIESDCKPLNWLDACDDELPLRLPLGIEEMASIMPGNIIVVAGVSNAGKTAFLMNLAKLNMNRFPVHYFSSEMGCEEFKKRVRRHTDLRPEDWEVKFYERSADFQDVIRPDDINIIDFLQIYDEFYKVGQFIHRIHEKLGRGIAVIALQKNKDAPLGLGGLAERGEGAALSRPGAGEMHHPEGEDVATAFGESQRPLDAIRN